MCYGTCPHEDSWGECRGVPGRDCPPPLVELDDIGWVDEAPESLARVLLIDVRWDLEVFCFYDRDENVYECDGFEAEDYSEFECDHFLTVRCYWDNGAVSDWKTVPGSVMAGLDEEEDDDVGD